MRVLIPGGTGLLGVPLAQLLLKRGHEVIILSRQPDHKQHLVPHGARIYPWDGQSTTGWGHFLDGETAIINLTGETGVEGARPDAQTLHCRLQAAEAIRAAIQGTAGGVRVVLQPSTVAYYGDCEDDMLVELSPPGEDPRATLCDNWERTLADLPVRQCLLRLGMVLHTRGGALPALLNGGEIFGGGAGGERWVPWVHYRDVARALLFLLEHETASGPFNIVAPRPVTDHAFLRALGQIGPCPALTPDSPPRLAFGAMAGALHGSQRAIPQRLLDLGFSFHFADVEDALRHLLELEAMDGVA